MSHIEGQDRQQSVLFPPTLDEYVEVDNPVRVIDAYVDVQDLGGLGFARVEPKATGRPGYAPGDLLKLYLYGYLNRLRSSRVLEQEAQRNVELMWLLKRLSPDFKTIADFRKDNGGAIRQMCRAFTLFCQEQGLIKGELVAIDGSKFVAVNNPGRNFTEDKLTRRIGVLEQHIGEYLEALERNDVQDPGAPSREDITRALKHLKENHANAKARLTQLQESGESQLSLTDADARSMKAGAANIVGYNVQTVVDAGHKLMVTFDVNNACNDRNQLSSMALEAKTALNTRTLTVVADVGYCNAEEVAICMENGITPYVPRPKRGGNEKRGLYGKDRFCYQRDSYTCPAGEILAYQSTSLHQGRPVKIYGTPACKTCLQRSHCTTSKVKGRIITRSLHEDALDAMAKRVKAAPEMMRARKGIVEHPFGTIKRAWNQGYFLMRGLANVRTEMSLTVLAYNLRRVINILGTQKLLAVLA